MVVGSAVCEFEINFESDALRILERIFELQMRGEILMAAAGVAQQQQMLQPKPPCHKVPCLTLATGTRIVSGRVALPCSAVAEWIAEQLGYGDRDIGTEGRFDGLPG